MRVLIEAEPGELAEKGYLLIRRIADEVASEASVLAKALRTVADVLEDAGEDAVLRKADLGVQVAAASQMGNRAVGPGGSGLNMQVHSPVQLKPQADSRSGRAGRLATEDEEELAYRRQSMKPRKKGIERLIVDAAKDKRKVFELPQPEFRDEAFKDVAARAPAERASVQDRAERFRGGPAPTGPSLMLPASLSKTAEPADPAVEKATRSSKSSTARPPHGKTLATSAGLPLPPGASHTVSKRGLGDVTLSAEADGGLSVTVADTDPRAFPSLSAACDYVWALQNGYEDAKDAKAQLGRGKLPSGAGWKFWGIKARGKAGRSKGKTGGRTA